MFKFPRDLITPQNTVETFSSMGGFGIGLLSLVLSSTIMLQSSLTAAQTYVHNFSYDEYKANTTYESNLNLLLSSMSDAISRNNTRFYNATVGRDPDTIFGIFQCRGDLDPQTCKKCAETATSDIKYRCPHKRRAMIWYDECFLRYDYNIIFSTMAMDPKKYFSYAQNVSNPAQFTSNLNDLMHGLVKQAVNSTDIFAVGVTNGTNSQRIYGLVQCTQDISLEDCDRCLTTSILQIPLCCQNKDGGRILKPNCVLWFEIYKFFVSDGSIFSPTFTYIPSGKENNSSDRILISVVSIIFVVASLSIFSSLLWSMRSRRYGIMRANVNDIATVESLQFNFGAISAATDNFSDSNKLGEGGFGVVYKGSLPDGRQIAAKRLSQNSRQGVEEFKNEVFLLAKLQHRNLVRLLGFSLQGDEKLLIYEYVPNGSLDSFIFDETKRRDLDWDRRYRIIVGIARGLLYLHEDSRDRIIHRDLKGSNVLIDEHMLPKISDFGMARLFEVDQTQGRTSKIVGTYGYMAPEYAMHGHFSVRTDVFSFGVVVLEIVTGHKNSSFYRVGRTHDLICYVWRQWQEGTAEELIEPTLQQYPRSEVMRCLHIGLLCVQEDVGRRPTMTAVVLMLGNYSFNLPSPSTPAFFAETTADFNMLKDENGTPSTV